MTDDPYAVFRPRRGRVVPVVVAVISVLVFTVVALTIPGKGSVGWSTPDRVMLIGFGLLFGAGLLRFAQVRAVPSREGLLVRNLLSERRVEWAQVVNVQFGGGSPWAVLELDDTDTLAVMAIQRSDGDRAVQEARRLAALVEGSRPQR
ncbi:PH domain-containing protein [Luteipulveratus sp. YIM 133132]|uniref:PH domain-containing protein n=1 Tax=Luteipulveratus flavus TaxID=3031728 RepID=A0ABT6C7T3_9MICO|nr:MULTISPECIES: PH domain-containing protein [unclassified Luteipulveratus]MDE9366027.1 PH domain-containing protein [Luteipulveratus sp. YIM 133132]MDF8264129.1 PH domain-containing protein [Luteipulveratus sp. YIM 133296]